jgi:hypothetical protein
MRNLFLTPLAGYCPARQAAATFELLAVPELLNVQSAGVIALLLQNGLYRRWELVDIRRLRTRSLRGVVHAPDCLNDDPVWCLRSGKGASPSYGIIRTPANPRRTWVGRRGR